MTTLKLVKTENNSFSVEEQTHLELNHLISNFTTPCCFQTDTTGVILNANERFCQLLKRDVKQLKSVKISSFCSTDDKIILNNAFQDLLGEKKINKKTVEISLLSSTQPTLWVQATITSVEQTSKEACFFFELFDITKFKQKQISLQSSEQEMARFCQRVTYDLRNPLSAISQVNNIVESELDAGNYKSARTFAALSQKTVNKLNSLILGVLSINEVRTPKDDIHAPIDPSAIIRECVERIKPKAEQANIEIVIVQQHERDFVGNYQVLMKAVDSLLSNAVKFNDKLKERQYIEVITCEEGDMLVIHVRDNGLGISKRYHRSLFQMFSRFHPSVADGAGLGLYLVKKCVEELSGTVSFSELENETGSNFTLSIPINDKEST